MTAIAPGRRRRMPPLARREARWGMFFLLPWIIGFLAFTLIPMIATLIFTFTNVTLTQDTPLHFVGLDNYANLISDPATWASLGVNLKFAILALPVGVLAQPQGTWCVPDPVLPALRGPVRGRCPDLAVDAQHG